MQKFNWYVCSVIPSICYCMHFMVQQVDVRISCLVLHQCFARHPLFLA